MTNNNYRAKKKSILDTIDELGETLEEDTMTLMLSKRKLQQFYSSYLSRLSVKSYEDHIRLHGTEHDKARIFSNDGSFAGAWLYAVPERHERHMDNLTFRRCIMLRLGIPFHDRPQRCKCANHPVIDSHVDHILNCKKFSAAKIARHDAITADIKSLCKMATIHFSDPVLGHLRTPEDNDNKAADGCLTGYRDKPVYIDITISNPTSSSYIAKSANLSHYTIGEREEEKNKKYSDRCRAINSEFMPLAFEIYGARSKIFDDFLRSVVKTASKGNSIPYSILLSYWRRRISTTLQIYFAKLV